MCGIIAVLRKTDIRPPLEGSYVVPVLVEADERLSKVSAEDPSLHIELSLIAELLTQANISLRSMPGVRLLISDSSVREKCRKVIESINNQYQKLELVLDQKSENLEDLNASVSSGRDAAWAIAEDRLRNALAIIDLAKDSMSENAVSSYWSIQTALSSLDRMEVRGRDSAGLQIFVANKSVDLSQTLDSSVSGRLLDTLFTSGALRTVGKSLVFVYKVSSAIGELGENTRELRKAITSDQLLKRCLNLSGSKVSVIGHTRWASVGIISEANAHPVDSLESNEKSGPYVAAVLNGDVDNFADLKVSHRLAIAPEITTDAKVVPVLISQSLQGGKNFLEAFRSTVREFEGSVAIAAHAETDEEQIAIALRGSGQGLYVGMAEGVFVVASEPYGLVEETDKYLRMDGESLRAGQGPGGNGQIIILDAENAGERIGIKRISYDGLDLGVAAEEITKREITTRDIDRGDAPHFLLKEISEAPESFRKTLRGRIVENEDGTLKVVLGATTIPDYVATKIENGSFNRLVAIGQGTAAIAAQVIPQFLSPLTEENKLIVEAQLATEFSGFQLTDDMSDTLVVAVSQSGTTTDTNRTVDLARARGATVIAIVNRRSSELAEKADGVLYTSDGRDIEMSVASTKAFYAQIAAGILLVQAIAEKLPGSKKLEPGVLKGLRELPAAMNQIIADRHIVAKVAQRHAPAKRYWAIVGNGANRIAAKEVRIKLSELCYKSIAEDATEDKKHIDLSSEPLIFVCAAGLTGSNVDDIAKEVAIYRAHKATPIVVASEEESRFSAASELITVPRVHPALDFILSATVGHLFGYEAAVAIDHQALPLREMRSILESKIETGILPEGSLDKIYDELREPASRFLSGLRSGAYDGHLEASTATSLTTILRYGLGTAALDSYQLDVGKVGRPGVVVEDLVIALSRAIDELTRPIDAIKHQAKTVTVGISRSDETLLQSDLVREALQAGAPRDRLSYRELRALLALDPAVAKVIGYTRYRIEGNVDDEATIQVIDRGGIAREINSRTTTNSVLRGSKHRAAFEREVTVSQGSDGRNVIHIPEIKDGETTGLTLLHCRFEEKMSAAQTRSVLEGYRGRYGALKDAVTESQPFFRDDLLETIPIVNLLTKPVYVLAELWMP
ncbi:MAG: SIS domain-containing protein [Actinomycetota bacterium]